MDNMNENNMEQMHEDLNMHEATNKKTTNNLVAIALILFLLIVGGIYAFMKIQERSNEAASDENASIEEILKNDPVINAPESTSTNPVDIEKDLNVTDLDSLDSTLDELNQI